MTALGKTLAPWKASAPSKNVTLVKCDTDTYKAGQEWWFLLRADVHHDNPKCDQAMEKKHLEQAKDRGAGVLTFGDYFCAMQGKWDKRSSKDSIRPEHQCGNYLDALVREAADFNVPYAANHVLFSDGNHETSIRLRHETDLVERLCATMHDRTGASIQHGGYTGFVRFQWAFGNHRESVTLWYTHGYGGGGPVTKDMIQAHRQRNYIGDADIMVSGHTHDSWTDSHMRVRLNHHHQIEQVRSRYIKLGTYKDAWADGAGGWELEKGHPPKPKGAWWLKFEWAGRTGGRMETVVMEAI